MAQAVPAPSRFRTRSSDRREAISARPVPARRGATATSIHVTQALSPDSFALESIYCAEHSSTLLCATQYHPPLPPHSGGSHYSPRLKVVAPEDGTFEFFGVPAGTYL